MSRNLSVLASVIVSKAPVIALSAITVMAICVTTLHIAEDDTSDVITPDYAVQATEENAEAIENDTTEKLSASEGGGAVSLSYSTDITIDLTSATASLYFANPGKSTQDIVLVLTIHDTTVFRSGLISPGSQVTTMSLSSSVSSSLAAGGYDGTLSVLFYDCDTGERAVVTTEIPVTVTVTK